MTERARARGAKRHGFSEEGLRRAIAEGWAAQTPETAWLDDAGQPIPEVIARSIIDHRPRVSSRSLDWWTPERREEAAAAARRRHEKASR